MRLTLSFFIILSSFLSAKAQQPVQKGIKDSTRTILIRAADRLGFDGRDSSDLTYAAGHVFIIQGATTIECDSAIYNRKLNMIEAYGNVHVNDADSVHSYSQVLKYYGNTKKALLTGNVKLTDTKGLMMTEELEYDLAARVATYHKGATIYNKSTKLTSQEGIYYTSTKDAYFSKNVRLEDPQYTMATDTLLFNTESQIATFVAPTTINDGKNIIRTSSGFYDLKNGNASFGNRTRIDDKDGYTTADKMVYDKKTGMFQAEGSFIKVDSTNGLIIMSDQAFGNDSSGKYLFTRHPVLIIKQEKDSVYVTADTIYAGRISDLEKKDSTIHRDTINKVTVYNSKKDSADRDRYFQAFHHVKIFSDSLQAAGDSLFYSFKDSTFKLFQTPIVWANNSQITGDTIYLFTKNKKPDHIKVFENSYVINKVDSNFYNQIKSTRLFGYFNDGVLDSIRAKGNAESIYFVQDDDSAFISVNKSRGDVIDMYFSNKQLKRVVFRNSVSGTNYPMKEAIDDNIFLRGFRWQEKRRPKNKAEILGQ
jgi:lipopolysaccharide export system protein LptA